MAHLGDDETFAKMGHPDFRCGHTAQWLDVGHSYYPRAMKKWILATLLITSAAVAQQTHNQYEPANAPGAGQKLLAQFAGEWDVVKTFFPASRRPESDERHV